MNQTKDSPFQRGGDGDSQHGKTLRYSIPYLPEDIWHHIHSLMPVCDAARAACLSRVFLRSWRCRPNLTLNWQTLHSKGHVENFSCKIDSILRNHSGMGLKILKLNLDDDYRTFPYIDSWLQVAFTPGIEELTLTLYKKSVSAFCAYYGCLLSNSLALEQLDLYDCKEITLLKIPSFLQQLSSLSVTVWRRLQEIECKVPNLSTLNLHGKAKLSLGETLKMKNLSVFWPNVICYGRAELPCIMPNLDTLDLGSEAEVVNTPMLPTKFLYLKHLIIYMTSGVAISPSYDYVSLVSFFDVSPSLETFLLDVYQEPTEHESVFGGSSHLRQLPERRHDCLKRVEIRGFNSAKSLIGLTCYILKNAVSLECLMLDTLHGGKGCSGENNGTCWPISKTVLKEASRTVMAIRMYIEDKVPPTAKLTVREPCTRCHSS